MQNWGSTFNAGNSFLALYYPPRISLEESAISLSLDVIVMQAAVFSYHSGDIRSNFAQDSVYAVSPYCDVS